MLIASHYALEAGFFVDHGNRRAGHNGAARIVDRADNRGGDLGENRACAENGQEAGYNSTFEHRCLHRRRTVILDYE